jgi:dienelactone hydrolase
MRRPGERLFAMPAGGSRFAHEQLGDGGVVQHGQGQSLPFGVAAIALAFGDGLFGFGAAVRGEGFADVDGLAKLAGGFAADETFVAGSRLQEFAFAGRFFGGSRGFGFGFGFGFGLGFGDGLFRRRFFGDRFRGWRRLLRSSLFGDGFFGGGLGFAGSGFFGRHESDSLRSVRVRVSLRPDRFPSLVAPPRVPFPQARAGRERRIRARMNQLRIPFSGWGLAAFFSVANLVGSDAQAESMRALERFESGGKSIRMETFVGADAKDAPSVIVLHGSTGVEFANRFIANLAQSFAAQGFVVHLVHYFDRTGDRYADDRAIKASSSAWLETVHDAVTFVRTKRPEAAIGMFGYSLGGYLAAAETVGHSEISAAVILSGGLDEASAKTGRHAPPVLILHGSADTRVPVSESRRLEETLSRLGHRAEVHLYPGEGHIMSLPAYADVVTRGSEFLRRHLNKTGR